MKRMVFLLPIIICIIILVSGCQSKDKKDYFANYLNFMKSKINRLQTTYAEIPIDSIKVIYKNLSSFEAKPEVITAHQATIDSLREMCMNSKIWYNTPGTRTRQVFVNNDFEEEVKYNTITEMKKEVDLFKNKMTESQIPFMVTKELESVYSPKAKKIKAVSDKYGWTIEETQRILHNKIWIGMPISGVIYRRGRPDDINSSDYGSGIQRQYVWYDWNPSCFYDTDDDGLVDAYN